jgi:tetrahydromethanopterin S-methyltransferase subunit G
MNNLIDKAVERFDNKIENTITSLETRWNKRLDEAVSRFENSQDEFMSRVGEKVESWIDSANKQFSTKEEVANVDSKVDNLKSEMSPYIDGIKLTWKIILGAVVTALLGLVIWKVKT